MILVISPKNVYATKRLGREAEKIHLPMEIVDVKDLAKRKFKVDVSQYEVLYARQSYPYNGKIIGLAEAFRHAGKRVVDQSIADGDLGLGKWEVYQRLMAASLPAPETKIFNSQFSIFNSKPKIIKWNYGFGGKGTFIIHNQAGLDRIAQMYPKQELLVQEFIDADYEYKVMTVGFKALPAVLKIKFDKKTLRPDFSKCQVVNKKDFLTPAVKKVVVLAEHSSRILGRELAKVDILEKDGQFYILEVNRWPGLHFFERKSGFNVAGEFVKYLGLCVF